MVWDHYKQLHQKSGTKNKETSIFANYCKIP